MKKLWQNVFFRYGIAMVVMVGIYCALKAQRFSAVVLSDAFAMAALLFAALGAWRYVLRQGTFASSKYGFLKLKEVITTKNYSRGNSKLPPLGEFVRDYRCTKSILRPMLAAALAVALSAIVWVVA